MDYQKTAIRFAWIVILIYFAYTAGFIVLADIESVLAGVPDDAAYFFKTGENIAAGEGLTFDGINRSNGFQPLWLLVVAGIASIFRGSPELMFRCYMLLQAALAAAGAAIVLSVHRRVFKPLVTLVVMLLFLPLVLFQSVNGMESALFVFCAAVAFLVVFRLRPFESQGTLRLFSFGLLLGIVMLSRLDSVFIGASVCALVLYRLLSRDVELKSGIKMLVLVIGGASVVVVPYLVYNHVQFGSLMPISGSLKSTFPAFSFSIGKVMNISSRFLLAVLAAPFYLAWSVAVPPSADSDRNRFRASVGILASAVILHFLHSTIFLDWAVFSWHFISYSMFLSLAVSEPAELCLERFKRMAGPALAAIAVLLFAAGGAKVLSSTLGMETDSSWRVQSYRAARWARNSTAPHAVFAMKDAGNFGYFSKRAVINLDGLVNSGEYQEVLRDGSLREYLKTNHVGYLVQQCVYLRDSFFRIDPLRSTGPEQDGTYECLYVRYWSHRFDTYSDAVPLFRSNEVYRSEKWNARAVLPFMIWKLDLSPGDCAGRVIESS